MALACDRTRKLLRACPRRRQDPGEAERIAPGNRDPCRLRRRGSQVAGDPLGKGAGPNMSMSQASVICSSRLSGRSPTAVVSIRRQAYRPPRGHGMASTSADVAIIGCGLMGCTSAYFLRRRGRSVVVIEKGSACAAASGVNFGNLRLQGRAPQEFPLSLRSQAICEDLARLTGKDCGIVPCGHLYLGFAASDQPMLERTTHEARAAGLDVELLDGPCVRRRWPVLSGAVMGASWSKRDAVAEPAIASPAVVRLAQRAGARLLEYTKVIAVARMGPGFALRTDLGHTVTCGQVVNAAGAWAGEIAGQFG